MQAPISIIPANQDTPSTATSAALILAQLKSQPCNLTRLDLQTFPGIQVADGPSLDQVKNLMRWIDANMGSSPDYRLVSARTLDTLDTVRTYTDTKDGGAVTTSTMLGQMGANPFGRASVEFCSYRIDGVQILDTTMTMPKLAQITYTVTVSNSDTAARLTADPSLGFVWAKSSMPVSGESTATLRKLDATGWRVQN